MSRKLPRWLQGVEHFIDLAIPFMLVLLGILIILEFTHYVDDYHDFLMWLDYFIILFFIADLSFKWYHVHNYLKFIKLYWVDLLAIFPFYTVFRVYRFAAEAAIATEEAQKLVHEAALLREAKVLREAELSSKIIKEGKFIRLFARVLRVLKARFYMTTFHLHAASSLNRKKER